MIFVGTSVIGNNGDDVEATFIDPESDAEVTTTEEYNQDEHDSIDGMAEWVELGEKGYTKGDGAGEPRGGGRTKGAGKNGKRDGKTEPVIDTRPVVQQTSDWQDWWDLMR